MNWKSSLHVIKSLCLLTLIATFGNCGIYSFTGSATAAKTIQVDDFFNNTDLAPANIGQNFTNRLRDYYQQNSQLSIVAENGELQIEGIIADYRISPVAPVASGNAQNLSTAAQTRLTITVKVNYVDTLVPTNSFKDRTFSFYDDFRNDEELTSVQERLERKIFDQILIDIFNATVANW
jgi:hypothetical protein